MYIESNFVLISLVNDGPVVRSGEGLKLSMVFQYFGFYPPPPWKRTWSFNRFGCRDSGPVFPVKKKSMWEIYDINDNGGQQAKNQYWFFSTCELKMPFHIGGGDIFEVPCKNGWKGRKSQKYSYSFRHESRLRSGTVYAFA